ncbi:MAG: hypothetical protein QOJ02_3800 [Acidobacteriota bacterium]|jgi:hypothetical protein|nr:hypothetical protein [Acidobacteriota bacterium]
MQTIIDIKILSRRKKIINLIALGAFAFALGALFIQACGYREATVEYRKATASGNEAAAIKTLQMLATSQGLYNKMHRGNAYGTFDQLITDTGLDKRFAGDAPVVSGYVFKMTIMSNGNGQPAFFSVNADPQQSVGTSATGNDHFYIDANSNAITVNHQQQAGPNDLPVDQ